jgi:hypothetical protein
MKNIFFILLIFNLLVGCKNPNQHSPEKGPVNQAGKNTLSVDSLLVNPAGFAGKQVIVSGMVAHVCKHGGQKLFLVGTLPEKYLRINTGKKIAEFPVDLEGSTIEVIGTVTKFENEAPEDSEAITPENNESDNSRLEKGYHKDNFYVVAAESYTVNK